jgi:hypothetical protein
MTGGLGYAAVLVKAVKKQRTQCGVPVLPLSTPREQILLPPYTTVLLLNLRRLFAPVARGAALGEFEDGGRLPDLDPSRRHRRQAVQEGDVLAPDVLQPPVVEGEVGLAAVAVGPAGSGGGAGGAEGGGAGHGCEKKSVLCVCCGSSPRPDASSRPDPPPPPLTSSDATRRHSPPAPLPPCVLPARTVRSQRSPTRRAGRPGGGGGEGAWCGLCCQRGTPTVPA